MQRRIEVIVITCVVLLGGASFALAENKPVPTSQEWSGSVADESLQAKAPAFVANPMAFEELWKSWKVGDKVPEVDFTKNLAVVATTRGSVLRLRATLDEKGNLQVGGIATRDLRPGFRYVIGIVPREGVVAINGKPVDGAR